MRVHVTLASDPHHHKVIPVPQSVEGLLTAVAERFGCEPLAWVALQDGSLVCCISDLCADDVLVAGREGDAIPFVALREDDEVPLVAGPSCAASTSEGESAAPSGGPPATLSRQVSMTLRRCKEGGTGEGAPDWVRLNVGGTIFATTRATLTRDTDSMFTRMFGSDTWKSVTDDSGAYMLDRSPRYFEPLLNFLRHGAVILDEGLNPYGVMEEAVFFNVESLVAALAPVITRHEEKINANRALTRQDVVSLILSTSSVDTLRCQGVNFEGADLSNLDLRNINFKMANLRGCNLSNCDLQFCNFERAILANASLDHSNFMGCTLSRANLENATLRDCNFNDPSQCSTTNLEGANMRGCDLEDSNLSCVNLRVATLKNARLANVNLRCANLAGTDLGNADLSGPVFTKTKTNGWGEMKSSDEKD